MTTTLHLRLGLRERQDTVPQRFHIRISNSTSGPLQHSFTITVAILQPYNQDHHLDFMWIPHCLITPRGIVHGTLLPIMVEWRPPVLCPLISLLVVVV